MADLPQTIEEAYRSGLGDGMVYATALMARRHEYSLEWLDFITEKKRSLASAVCQPVHGERG